MILNGINFGSTFYGLYIVEHYGRRKSLIVGGFWMSAMFFIFASVGHFSLDRDDPPSTESAGTAMIVIASFFIFGTCLVPLFKRLGPLTLEKASPLPGVR